MPTIAGSSDDDTLRGTVAADRITGGSGDDTLAGGAGNDRLWGQADSDRLSGGQGDDDLSGGSGDDAASGGDGDDTVRGGSGDDRLGGGAGDDELDGGSGDDVLTGGNGNDRLDGSDGADVLGDSGGRNRLDGGDGSDLYRIANRLDADDRLSSALVAINRYADSGGSGTDVIQALANASGQTLIGVAGLGPADGIELIRGVAAAGYRTSIVGSRHGHDRIDLSATRLQDIAAVHGDIANGDGNDVLVGNGQGNRLFGDGGDDRLEGRAGDDGLDGGRGNDRLQGGEGQDRLSGGTGDDSLEGGAGNDSLRGGDGNDTAVFAGNRGDYRISWTDGQVRIEDLNSYGGDDGVDLLGDIEWARFADGTTQSLAPPFELSSLDGSNGFVINGAAAGDSLFSVGKAGDVNGDGIGDLIIGAGAVDSNGISSGASYVVFGSSEGFVERFFEISMIDGTSGFAIKGVNAYDYSGSSVSGGGDVNGDGLDDIIIGAPRGRPDYPSGTPGASYVVFGRCTNFASAVELSALDGKDGFTLHGVTEYDLVGLSVSVAGDINGDGIDDLIVGAPRADVDGQYNNGASYIVFGSSIGLGASLDLAGLDGDNGFTIVGAADHERFGHSVSSAGDVNGDGIGDVIVGAPYGNGWDGAGYVVFGSSNRFDATINVATLDGSDGFALTDERPSDLTGWSVGTAGNFNGDIFDDIIIAADDADVVYVVFGSALRFDAKIDLSALDGRNGVALKGVKLGDLTGHSVSGAGDVNGDGLDDIIIGAYRADSFAGASYVVFGSSDPFGSYFELGTLNGRNGFVIAGENEADASGARVSGAGDVNADGFDDLLLSAPGANDSAGAAYVVFGSASGFAARLDVASLSPLPELATVADATALL